MAAPSVTNTFTNGTTADATEVNQNFTDIINALTDGTSDLTFNQLTANGAASFNGTVGLGNATGDTITFTGYAGSSLIPDTNASYDFGTSALGWQALYLDNDVTDGGTIYFNAGGSSISSTADGARLDINTFTVLDLNAVALIDGVLSAGRANAVITFTDDTQDEVVINEGGADADFRVEGDNDTHAIFVDGATDNVGVGTSTGVPDAKFHVQDGSSALGPSVSNAVFFMESSNTGTGYEFCIPNSAAGEVDVIYRNSTGRIRWRHTLNNAAASNNNLQLEVGGFSSMKMDADGAIHMDDTNWGTGGTDVGIVTGSGLQKLTTAPSSIRYKSDVKPLEVNSSVVWDLEPRSFTYSRNPVEKRNFGYIAEEVAEICPELVVYRQSYDEEGRAFSREKDGAGNDIPEAVHYKYLPVLLLEEMKKLRKRIAQLEGDA